MVGAGVIGRTAIMAVSETVPTLETIYLCDLDISKAEALKKEFEGTCKATIIPSTDTEGCIKKSELIITQTTASKPFLKAEWVNKGSTVIQMAFQRSGARCCQKCRSDFRRLLDADDH